MKVVIDCGNLQPGCKVWTDSFQIGIGRSAEVLLKGHVLAANLPQPQEFSLKINADIQQASMTLDQLFELEEKK